MPENSHLLNARRTRSVTLAVVSSVVLGLSVAVTLAYAQAVTNIKVARFNDQAQLLRPADLEHWVLLGASIGHGYSGGRNNRFSSTDPGLIQVVTMEPTAFAYFKENAALADGTMLSLSFYRSLPRPEPLVDGIVQGDLASFEIHLIDKERFADKSAFYLFKNEAASARMIPAGNDCVSCHNQHGSFDSTFAQFYPPMRNHLSQEH